MTTKKKAPPRTITPELIRDALACISPDIDRDTWARLAMAIKSELGGDGFELWDAWSRKGETYEARNAKDTWRGIKAGGATTIGTLFGIAKDHGFRFPEPADETRAGACTTPAAEQLAADQARRAREREAEAARYRERADEAARLAVRIWGAGLQDGVCPYLARKGVTGHGVRYLADGTLLVPMRDAAGELQNLQRIAPVKPADGQPEKRFLAGGRKSGLMHWCGDPTGAPVLLVAEGYATAASLHEATGRPVAVAFDAGNLVHVARALREHFPAVPLLVCGDDDRDTEARTGKNPGRDKAATAARVAHADGAGACTVFPEGLPAGGSDFNDLAVHAGLDVFAAPSTQPAIC